jgi:hypothetical protein
VGARPSVSFVWPADAFSRARHTTDASRAVGADTRSHGHTRDTGPRARRAGVRQSHRKAAVPKQKGGIHAHHQRGFSSAVSSRQEPGQMTDTVPVSEALVDLVAVLSKLEASITLPPAFSEPVRAAGLISSRNLAPSVKRSDRRGADRHRDSRAALSGFASYGPRNSHGAMPVSGDRQHPCPTSLPQARRSQSQ